ncbi:MAG: 23S rRNA (pseudouridine(1915)-N(3))-methyltransferase RlmH [Mycoplasmataceae bacterium]|nr:23S rRNA (pseudouridine(1915)-N(3))-methyltransferase RlmH [Mycoplasmataceae bacterium]
MIKIISIGQSNDYQANINDYAKRLKNQYKITFIDIENSKSKNIECRNIESEKILKHLDNKSYIILLDEIGKPINNLELNKTINIHNNITFIIGGSYGVSEKIKKSVNLTIKISDLIFPHEIVKLILTEQIYRSQCINENHPYHHI